MSSGLTLWHSTIISSSAPVGGSFIVIFKNYHRLKNNFVALIHPLASEPSAIECDENEFISLVATPIEKYRRKNKAVKKTLTIPQWLNEEAELKHINFSSVLQKALKAELLLAE